MDLSSASQNKKLIDSQRLFAQGDEESLNVLFFGDQTAASDLPSYIGYLYHQCSRSTSLRAFLQSATDTIQDGFMNLSLLELGHFPSSFLSILDLAELHDSQKLTKNVVLSTVLLCIAQLGSLILEAEIDPFLLVSSNRERCMFGVCTGLISAAAASVASSVKNLVDIGPEIVSIALRTGLEAHKRAQRIEPGRGNWSLVIIGIPTLELQAILEDFHRCTSLPKYMSVYISAFSTESSTLSAPPSVLRSLLAFSKILENSVKQELPIAAAFHAPHLQRPDYEKIMGSSAVLDLPLTGNLRLVLTSSNTSIDGNHFKNLRELLMRALEDVFQSPIYWTNTVETIFKHNSSGESKSKAKVSLSSFGPCLLVKSFLKTATAIQDVEVTVTKPESVTSHQTDANLKSRSGSGDIAIISMAGRFPGASTLEEFWKILSEAQDLHRSIPKDRFDIKDFYDPTGESRNSTISPFGCFIEEPGLFDSRLFRMSPREAKQTDPIQRLLLLSTYEALQMAGYSSDECGTLTVPLSMRGSRIATFFGQTTDDWRECNASQDIDNFYIPGGMRAFGPGRLNYWFKWEGASYSIDTACSSSSAAVELAVRSLLSRQCDTAVAGGGNIISGPSMYAGLSKGSFLSPTGNCKTFSDDADGYCRGDAVGVVILKRLEDAIADNDNIQGIIKSIHTNHSALATSITHPHAPTQQKLYKKVLQDAAVDPFDVQYVEMHGTGTQAGDAAEMESVQNVFGNNRPKNNPLYIGAVKANIGHSEAGAGISSLIKSLLMLRKETIPPHPMTGALNSKFSLEGKNIFIASSSPRLGNSTNEPKRILLNNFNATGGNTALLLEGPPVNLPRGKDPRDHHIITTSASTPFSLGRNTENLLQHIESNPSISLSDLAYTTTARRIHHGLRNAFPVSTITELRELLIRDLKTSPDKSTESTKVNGRPSIVFVFSGQGSLTAGLGEHLYNTCARFREDILAFESICVNLGFPSFIQIITTPSMDHSSVSTLEIQLATVSLELAISNLWKRWGLKPDLVIGHSIGEYAALHVAGVLSLMDMFYLVGKRAELLLEKCSANTHTMLAIKAPSRQVRDILDGTKYASCSISCHNSPVSVVVSGPSTTIQILKDHLIGHGIDSVTLNVPYAFHSPQIQPIASDFLEISEKIQFMKPSIPIASSLLGKVVEDLGVFSPDYLTRHAIEEVNFVGAVEACRIRGLTNEKTIWIENGPGSSTIGMVKATIPVGLAVPTLKHSESAWKTLSKSAASIYCKGISIDWPEYHREYKDTLRLLELPRYAFDLKNCWIPYKGSRSLANNASSPTPGFSTTCLQKIETETFSGTQASVIFVSDVKEEKLLQAIRGHLVNGIALCPSSVYSDMAFTAAYYVYSKQSPSVQVPSMDLTLMEVFHPLVVATDDGNHEIIVTATRPLNSPAVHITFSSRQGSLESEEHAHCVVTFGEGQRWMDSWSRNSYLISDRRDSLFCQSSSHPTHRIMGSLVYKLFSTLVDYSSHYRCLTEVFMSEVLNEAAAKLKFRTSPPGTVFTYSPYWIDSIVHLAGFVLNGHVTTAQDDVFISHGWESLKIAAPLSEVHEYTSYVRMQPVGTKGVYVGDVSIFQDDQIVAACSGLKFQKLKKNILLTLLKGTSNTKRTSPAANTESLYKPAKELISKQYFQVPTTSIKPKPKTKPRGSEGSETSKNIVDWFSVVRKIISEEIGVDIQDLTDETRFEDLGVDSLLTISITQKLRTQTNFDIPTSVFSSCETVALFHDYLKGLQPQGQNSNFSTEENSINDSDSENHAEGTSSSATSLHTDDSEYQVVDAFVSAIAEETGLQIDDLKDGDALDDLGIDSIMSIAIVGSVKRSTGDEFPTSIFTAYPTLGLLKRALVKLTSPSTITPVLHKSGREKPEYSSNSVLLQGDRNSGLPTLFLIADGAGSAASYINIPEFSPKLLVYALESPFLHCPTEFNCSIQEVAQIFITKLRSIQSKGPYFLGGWSLGGIFAFEVAHQLISNFNEEVRGIVMIDSPCPRPIDMPEPTMELMEQTGLFIGIKRAGKAETPMPLSQKQHLLSCVKALRVYDPVPIPRERLPRNVSIIWAKNGLFEKLGAKIKEAAEDESPNKGGEDNVGLKKDWLTAERNSFGPNGWERLLGEGIDCCAMEGDHFSIMNLPRIKVTGGLMQQAVNRFLAI